MSKLNNWFIQTEYDCSILPKNYFEDIVSSRNGYTGVSYGSGCIYSQGLINGDGTLSVFIPNNEIDENTFRSDRNNLHLLGYGAGDGIGNSNGFGCDDSIIFD